MPALTAFWFEAPAPEVRLTAESPYLWSRQLRPAAGKELEHLSRGAMHSAVRAPAALDLRAPACPKSAQFAQNLSMDREQAAHPTLKRPTRRGKQKPRKTVGFTGFSMVGVARIELATPAMSTQCSTTELHAHGSCANSGGWWGVQARNLFKC